MPNVRPTQDKAGRLVPWPPPTQVWLQRGKVATTPPVPAPKRRSKAVTDEDMDADIPILDRDPDDLSFMDDDPLTYFLTPADNDDLFHAGGAKDGDDDIMIDLDAGIEDSSNPPQTVRSVSPSSLDGGARRLGVGVSGFLHPPTPPRSPPASLSPELMDSATDDDDCEEEDEEDYVHLGASHPPALFPPSPPQSLTLRESMGMRHRKGQPHRISALSASFPPPSSPSSAAITANQGRTRSRFGFSSNLSPPSLPATPSRRGRLSGGHIPTANVGLRRRRLSPPHSWREPSPDVWSIEEEPEEEEKGDAVEKNTNVKPKKKVRFVLPVKG